MQNPLGFTHFLAQADGVAKAILAILLLMSMVTWYLIASKGIANLLMRKRSAGFLDRFWAEADIDAVARGLQVKAPTEPFGELVREGLRAIEQHGSRGAKRLVEAGSSEDFLTRALRRSLERTTAHSEAGLTVLASVGSSAPFVGLFGTVWGIYHALLAIGISGQGTLDKVAGPVGEALIMTAIGLAVAIPAVLAYNAFLRGNRIMLAELDGFAHDVFTFMSTGHRAEGEALAAIQRAVVQPAIPKAA